MRGSFIMPKVPWPTHGGREVYSHHLLAALNQLGHPTRVILTEARDDSHNSWPLASQIPLTSVADRADDSPCPPINLLDRRWRCYWAWSEAQLSALRLELERDRPDFVAAAGLNMLPALSVVPPGIDRIWLALDEPVGFQLSIGRHAASIFDKLRRLRLAATFAAYQRSYARRIDLAVAVSPADAQRLERIGGFTNVISLPNGVDAEHFAPQPIQPDPHTAVFWGRLDFEPNIQALRWFTQNVWPSLVDYVPHARLRIIGQNPDASLKRDLGSMTGVQWIGPVDDLRPWACRSSLAVMPIRSGSGIKNKLLEAAALARPIVASPAATRGLTAKGAWHSADSPQEWIEQMQLLWADPTRAWDLGQAARQWVTSEHSWLTNAQRLIHRTEHQSHHRVAHAPNPQRHAA